MRWFPDKSNVYAGTLLKALDFAAGGGRSQPAFANGMGQFRHFKWRFEMILNGKTRHSVTRVGILVALPCVAAILCTPAIIAKAEDAPQETQAVAESKEGPEDKVFTCVYALTDLPVWRIGRDGETKQFDASLVMALVESHVDPQSWKEKAGMSVYPANRSLVISQTRSNHRKIADLLERFHGKNGRK